MVFLKCLLISDINLGQKVAYSSDKDWLEPRCSIYYYAISKQKLFISSIFLRKVQMSL